MVARIRRFILLLGIRHRVIKVLARCASRAWMPLLYTHEIPASYACVLRIGFCLPFTSAGVRMTSSAGISDRWRKSMSSSGNIIFASVNGVRPPRLSRQELLMWLIIRFTSSCVMLSKELLPCGQIFRMYSWFRSQCGFCHEAIGSQ